MEAKFPSRCGYCGNPIAVGDPIGRSPRVAGWLHEACVERSQPSGRELSPSEFAARYTSPPEQQSAPADEADT